MFWKAHVTGFSYQARGTYQGRLKVSRRLFVLFRSVRGTVDPRREAAFAVRRDDKDEQNNEGRRSEKGHRAADCDDAERRCRPKRGGRGQAAYTPFPAVAEDLACAQEADSRGNALNYSRKGVQRIRQDRDRYKEGRAEGHERMRSDAAGFPARKRFQPIIAPTSVARKSLKRRRGSLP